MIKALKSKLKNRLNSKKGAISVIMVIFMMTLVVSFTLMLDTSYIAYGLREVQSKIDTAGINAMYQSIDLNHLRNEEMAIVGGGGSISSSGVININASRYTNTIRNAYIRELNNIEYPGENPTVRDARVSFEYSNFGLGFNAASSSSARRRPQLVLESMVSYEVPASVVIDDSTRTVARTVDSVHSGSEFRVTLQETGRDGRQAVLVHSITRIVLK